MNTIRTPFALVAASALLLLAGCTGGGATAEDSDTAAPSAPASSASTTPESAAAGGEQSKDDACQIIIASFTDVTEATQSMSSDPETAMSTFTGLVTKVQDDFAGITNAEIAPLAQDASDTLSDYVAFLQEVAADPNKASGLSDQITALQTSFTAAGQACEG